MNIHEIIAYGMIIAGSICLYTAITMMHWSIQVLFWSFCLSRFIYRFAISDFSVGDIFNYAIFIPLTVWLMWDVWRNRNAHDVDL